MSVLVTTRPTMDVIESPQERAFRAELRAWLERNRPGPEPEEMHRILLSDAVAPQCPPRALEFTGKLLWSDMYQRVFDTAASLLGAFGVPVQTDPRVPLEGRLPHALLSSCGRTIAAGCREFNGILWRNGFSGCPARFEGIPNPQPPGKV